MKKNISLALITITCITITWISNSTYYRSIISHIESAEFILISKQDMKLRLIDYKGNEFFITDIACGKNYGNKQKQGDMKTPEGIFQIVDIQNASEWKHDFHDGKGKIEGAYGPYFIRLAVKGHKGIGIHGTHDSLSIGTRATEGCIRLENKELKKLVPLLKIPMTVVITPSAMDEQTNSASYVWTGKTTQTEKAIQKESTKGTTQIDEVHTIF